jgi:hypothetical protein
MKCTIDVDRQVGVNPSTLVCDKGEVFYCHKMKSYALY